MKVLSKFVTDANEVKKGLAGEPDLKNDTGAH
jgi:hypothetical protein